MKEPIWLELQALLILHREGLDEHGGPDGIRDRGLLESALARPLNLFHYERVTDRCRLAAEYACGIVRNRPFNDGNKRAAFISAILFLKLNGVFFGASQLDATEAVLKLAAGEITEDAFARWLASHSKQARFSPLADS
jgi:death-on-curing protein